MYHIQRVQEKIESWRQMLLEQDVPPEEIEKAFPRSHQPKVLEFMRHEALRRVQDHPEFYKFRLSSKEERNMPPRMLAMLTTIIRRLGEPKPNQQPQHQESARPATNAFANRAKADEGPIDLTKTNQGPIDLTKTIEGPIDLTEANEGPVDLTETTEGPGDLTETDQDHMDLTEEPVDVDGGKVSRWLAETQDDAEVIGESSTMASQNVGQNFQSGQEEMFCNDRPAFYHNNNAGLSFAQTDFDDELPFYHLEDDDEFPFQQNATNVDDWFRGDISPSDMGRLHADADAIEQELNEFLEKVVHLTHEEVSRWDWPDFESYGR